MVAVLMFWHTLNLVNYTHGDIMVIVNLEMEQQIKVTLLFRFCPQTPIKFRFSLSRLFPILLLHLYTGLTPTLVQGALTGKTVVDVACGSHHSICLTSDGELYAWGKYRSIDIFYDPPITLKTL